MQSADRINSFLDKVCKKRRSFFAINGFYLMATFLTSIYLVGNGISYVWGNLQTLAIPIGGLLIFGLAYSFIRYFIPAFFSKFSREQAALLVEVKNPKLNDSLINSCQLQNRLNESDAELKVSVSFIKELLESTKEKIEGLKLESAIDLNRAKLNRNLFLSSLGVAILAHTLIPDFYSKGLQNFINPPQSKNAVLIGSDSIPLNSKALHAIKIKSIRLNYNYPAYTQIKPKTVFPSDGLIQALPGSEVAIEAESDFPLAAAEIEVNGKDRFSLNVKNGNKLYGSLLLRDSGYYRFRVKTGKNPASVLPKKYPIKIDTDNPPRVVLFLANPKPVYKNTDKLQFYYEVRDDFGIRKVELVYRVNGKPYRKLLKKVRTEENEFKNSYSWNLNGSNLKAGEEVQYFVEAFDNDNVSGPNAGQSETYTFKIFDTRKEADDLIALQDELIENMVALLADNLVENESFKTQNIPDNKRIKRFFAFNIDRLIDIIDLTERIRERAEPMESFSPAYLNFFTNMAKGLQTIRKEQIVALNQLATQPPGRTVPIAFSFPPVTPLTNKLINELERDILFLIKITNRQKMAQAVNLERELEKLTESLRDEFEKIKDKKNPISPDELKKKLDKIEQTFKQMMEQLAKQTQGLPDEFLNPESVQQLNLDNFQASLEKIKNLMEKGDIQSAMDELEKMTQDLQSLANQLDQSGKEMENLVDMETMERIDESLQDLEQVQKEQKDLLEKTTDMNKELRKAQLEKFEDELSKFFEALRRDVNAAQEVLQKTKEYLNKDPDLNRHAELLEKQALLDSKIRKFNQEAVNSALKPDLPKKFDEIRKTREEMTNIIRERGSLQLDEYYKFQRSLPEMVEKYDALEELTKLLDLKEFNELFKNTYPLAFRWQHNLRMVPQSSEELKEKMKTELSDLRQINAEISKKLGTFNREMKKEFEALISDQKKEQLDSMAKKQNEIRQEARDLAEKITEMGRINPTVPPQLSQKMGSAQGFMKSAQKNLSKKNLSQSVDSENQALNRLGETRQMLEEMKNQKGKGRTKGKSNTPRFGVGRSPDTQRGGSMRMKREKVDLPSEDQYNPPTKFRDDILYAMKRQRPKNYERLISEYYKELVK
jgi:hypothetical protein